MKPETIGFTVRTQIAKPIAEVFQAIVNPAIMTKYFAHQASGPIVAGSKVTWTWSGHDIPVEVLELDGPHHLKLTWKAFDNADYKTTFTFRLDQVTPAKTKVIVDENGWQDDRKGVNAALDNAKGWTDMLNCLKAYLEHGIDLRDQVPG